MINKLSLSIFRASLSLNNMILEMQKKNLELKRITKTAVLLKKTGFSSPYIFSNIAYKCIASQNTDGGWVSVVDTIWNTIFLSSINKNKYAININRGKEYLECQQGINNLWGRSARDFERIPVSAIVLYLLPEFATDKRMKALENLWYSEINSLTYKAAYVLMAFSRNNYKPSRNTVIKETVDWLINNQRNDGSFAPWKEHPASSDTYCTSLGLLGILSYKEYVSRKLIDKSAQWLLETQLDTGIWPYHEIEDGGSWAILALSEYRKYMSIQ